MVILVIAATQDEDCDHSHQEGLHTIDSDNVMKAIFLMEAASSCACNHSAQCQVVLTPRSTSNDTRNRRMMLNRGLFSDLLVHSTTIRHHTVGDVFRVKHKNNH